MNAFKSIVLTVLLILAFSGGCYCGWVARDILTPIISAQKTLEGMKFFRN